jgi:2Fe-2S ferredoxin
MTSESGQAAELSLSEPTERSTPGAQTALVRFTLEDMDVEVPVGSSFLDVVEASGADVTFGCRNGTCGTCRLRIEEGAANVAPMNREERDFLGSLEAGPCERLGCQLTILGDVTINYIG